MEGTKRPFHRPALVGAVVSLLKPERGGIYVDATVGGGGHARAILEAAPPDTRLIGIDWDEEAIFTARDELEEFGERVILVRENFARLGRILDVLAIPQVDGILFDLGPSLHQLVSGYRGFSLHADGPLDMRMDRRLPLKAADIVNRATEEELERIIREYGEEPKARAIAKAIVKARKERPLGTTLQLMEVVSKAIGKSVGQDYIHPATRTFMALRIAVNKEVEQLKAALEQVPGRLKVGGRLVIISYQSIEDRTVKHFLKEWEGRGVLKILTKKPVVPTKEEVEENPSSRGAKLRAAEKVSEEG
ncbi:MAG TPA: 16S rRNA (cytosine(1402)-N(4))-methyltransferase RsmH [Armatimonadetes bacterium]|nr:16S rRNA (cytosine(1402)-N(4))-methyltransferase RsmH [Armatimonadota bacterium]